MIKFTYKKWWQRFIPSYRKKIKLLNIFWENREKAECNCGHPENHWVFNGRCPFVKIDWDIDLKEFWENNDKTQTRQRPLERSN